MRGERAGIEVQVTWMGPAMPDHTYPNALTVVRAAIDPPLPLGLVLYTKNFGNQLLEPVPGSRPIRVGNALLRRKIAVRGVAEERIRAMFDANAGARIAAALRAAGPSWAIRVTDPQVEVVLSGDVSSVRELSLALDVAAELADDLKGIRRLVDSGAAYR
jgi:hypothetical protein